ncbi:MAG: hypothetical protein GX225_05215 [Clostridiales bacterium]|nr:hypothetical protein [Clostridiales bacterium]
MKKTILITMLFVTIMLMAWGCGKEDIEYGDEIGTVVGSVELSLSEPNIVISNIKSYVGDDIDFLSQLIVTNEGEFPDLETWVDASGVDIFTPGDYTATYRFLYSDKEFSKEIVVTIVERNETSAGDVPDSSIETPSEFQGGNSYISDGNGGGTFVTTAGEGGSNIAETTGTGGAANNGTTANNTTPTSGNNTIPTSRSNTIPTSGSNTTPTNKTPTPTSKRQMITSAGNASMEYRELGYYTIELLSGTSVKIKCTTSNYIVSTRTDITYTTKNNINYKVSKLIVTYNTGKTQVLETVEEKIAE